MKQGKPIGVVRLQFDRHGVLLYVQARQAYVAAPGDGQDRFEGVQRRVVVEGKSEGQAVFVHVKRIIGAPENRLPKIVHFCKT